MAKQTIVETQFKDFETQKLHLAAEKPQGANVVFRVVK